jgi:hypothetical protein
VKIKVKGTGPFAGDVEPAESVSEAQVGRLRDRLHQLDGLVPPRPPFRQLARERSRIATTERRRISSPLGSYATVLLAGVVVVAALLVTVRGSGAPKAGASPAAAGTPTVATSGSARVTAVSTQPATGSSGPASFVALSGAHLMTAAWAPDGQHVAVTAQPADTNPRIPTVQHIFDRAGHEVASVTADGFAWIGADSYLITRLDDANVAHQWTGQLGSTTETSVSVGSVKTVSPGPLSCVASSSSSGYGLMIGGKEIPFSGQAMACSPDGVRVAVMQITADTLPMSGWLQVVDATSGKVVRELRNARTYDRAWVGFSPDGSALGFDSGDSISIANLPTGKIVRVLPLGPLDGPETPAWLPSGRLAVPDQSQQTTRTFAIDGTEVVASLPYAPDLSVSSGGTVLAIDRNSVRVVVQSSDGRRGTLDLAATPNGVPDVSWSPDGQAAVLICTPTTSAGGFVYDETAILIAVS